MAQRSAVEHALARQISDGLKAKNSSRTASLPQAIAEASAASAGRLFLAALTGIRLPMAFLSARSMMIRA
jgi:hypothetical protein